MLTAMCCSSSVLRSLWMEIVHKPLSGWCARLAAAGMPPSTWRAVSGRKEASSPVSGLDGRDVDLPHLHHGVEGALGRGLIGVRNGFGQGTRRDLPRDAPLVLAPAARAFLAAVLNNRIP